MMEQKQRSENGGTGNQAVAEHRRFKWRRLLLAEPILLSAPLTKLAPQPELPL